MLRGERMAAIQKLRRGIWMGAGWLLWADTSPNILSLTNLPAI